MTLSQVIKHYEEGTKHLFQFYARSRGKPGKSADFWDIRQHCSMLSAAEFLRLCRDFGLAKLPMLSGYAEKGIVTTLTASLVSRACTCTSWVHALPSAPTWRSLGQSIARVPSRAERANAVMHRMDLFERRRPNNRVRGFGLFRQAMGSLRVTKTPFLEAASSTPRIRPTSRKTAR